MNRLVVSAVLVCTLAVLSGCRTQPNRQATTPKPTAKKAPRPAQPQHPLRGLIVYSMSDNSADYTYDGGRYDLYMMSIPDGKVTRLTNHQASEETRLGGAIRDPLFSPDGRKIAFRADYSDSDPERRRIMTGAAPNADAWLNVWILDLKTRKVFPLTTGDSGWMDVSWSPDSKSLTAYQQVGFSMLDSGPKGTFHLYRLDVASRSKRELPEPAPLSSGQADRVAVTPSPSGSRVAFAQGSKVYVAGRDGKAPVTATPVETSDGIRLAWSLDGEKLAILESKLQVWDAATGKTKVVATAPGQIIGVRWASNDKWLVCRTHGRVKGTSPTAAYCAYGGHGVIAVALDDGKIITLKSPNEDTKGIDWFELP